jgi:hypothetical protein
MVNSGRASLGERFPNSAGKRLSVDRPEQKATPAPRVRWEWEPTQEYLSRNPQV